MEENNWTRCENCDEKFYDPLVEVRIAEDCLKVYPGDYRAPLVTIRYRCPKCNKEFEKVGQVVLPGLISNRVRK